MPNCVDCGGKKYRIADRSDGFVAIERCDTCSYHGEHSRRTLWDEQAAVLANAEGVACCTSYPCYVLDADGEPKRWRPT